MPPRWCILSNLKGVFLIRFLTLLPTSILLVHREFFFFNYSKANFFKTYSHAQTMPLYTITYFKSFIQLNIYLQGFICCKISGNHLNDLVAIISFMTKPYGKKTMTT